MICAAAANLTQTAMIKSGGWQAGCLSVGARRKYPNNPNIGANQSARVTADERRTIKLSTGEKSKRTKKEGWRGSKSKSDWAQEKIGNCPGKTKTKL